MARRHVGALTTRQATAGPILDLAGLVVVIVAGGWTLVCAWGQPSTRPLPPVLLCVAATAVFGLGRRATGADRWLVPRVVAVGVAGAVLLGFPDVLRAGGGPTGYGNANSALVAIGCIAAGAAAAGAADIRARRMWVGTMVGLAAVVIGTSVAVTLLLLLVGALTAAAIAQRSAAVALAGGALVVAVTVGGTAAIAAGGDPLGLGARADVRAELWSSALDYVRDDPGRGIGPGRYEELSPVSSDPDFRWAHHGYLQQAAEQGVVGMLLLLAIVAWGFARLALAAAMAQAHALAGAAALTVVASHATVDHVLHHTAVPLTLALVLGWATARSGDVSRPDPLPVRETPGSPRSPR